jgi:hypothetical protein
VLGAALLRRVRAVGLALVGRREKDPSLEAAGWAGGLATAVGAEVVVVNAYIPVQSEIRPTTRSGCGTSRPSASRRGAPRWFRAVVSRGAPVAETILDVAGAEAADLLVVGARGVGGVTGLRIGGVALAVLHRADLPVVLVPPVTPEA